jgi:hypothetical protein
VGLFWSRIIEGDGFWTLEIWVVRDGVRHLAGQFEGSWEFIRWVLDRAPTCVAAWEGDPEACAEFIGALEAESGVHLVAQPVSSNRSGTGEP